MVRQTLILFAAVFERFAVALFEAARHRGILALVGHKVAREHKKLLAVAHTLTVGHRQRALAHREVVHRIDHIGLAGTIATHDAVDTLAGDKFAGGYILKVYKRNFFQSHSFLALLTTQR